MQRGIFKALQVAIGPEPIAVLEVFAVGGVEPGVEEPEVIPGFGGGQKRREALRIGQQGQKSAAAAASTPGANWMSLLAIQQLLDKIEVVKEGMPSRWHAKPLCQQAPDRVPMSLREVYGSTAAD